MRSLPAVRINNNMDIRRIASLGRFKDIVMILMKYGFDDLVQRLDLSDTPIIRRIHRADQELGTYERIRLAIEDLGPTFVKLGQVMSLRPDLLPRALVTELSKLQDDVAPVEVVTIHELIEKNLQSPLGELKIHFEHENLGGLRNTMENTFNRLTLGVIIAAMIIGSSMIITTGAGPLLFGFPALGILGYLISGILGLWLV